MRTFYRYFWILCFLPCFLVAHVKPSILIVYNASKKPNVDWCDGFVQAMNILKKKYEIHWCVPESLENKEIDFSTIDMIFVKSYWNNLAERTVRKYCPKEIPKALLISSTKALPESELFYYYDVLFYETFWFGKMLKHHPHAIHAFGINTNVMKPPSAPVEKIYDYIMVVANMFCPGKRPELILKKKGKKLAILGRNSANSGLAKKCRSQGIETLEWVDFHDLVRLYHQSKACYIPSTIIGGGDRSLLEARSCGLEVVVEKDNPKLMELAKGPIYSHRYYAKQLNKGIQVLLNKK